jgi:hypothetical protein
LRRHPGGSSCSRTTPSWCDWPTVVPTRWQPALFRHWRCASRAL